MAFIRQVTSLWTEWSKAHTSHVMGSRPDVVSRPARRRDFWGSKQEAAPYPPTRLFAVRLRLLSDSLASAFAPFLVELFAAGRFDRTPSLFLGTVPVLADARTPHASLR